MNDNISRRAAIDALTVKMIEADLQANEYAHRQHADVWMEKIRWLRGVAEGLALGLEIITALAPAGPLPEPYKEGMGNED